MIEILQNLSLSEVATCKINIYYECSRINEHKSLHFFTFPEFDLKK